MGAGSSSVSFPSVVRMRVASSTVPTTAETQLRGNSAKPENIAAVE
jgi:hypothetical protein